jgi:lipoprotein-anchoring transpeptidase ErfK/SrfK
MSPDREGSLQALKHAQAALRQGNRLEARRWAERAAALAPGREETWLWLAAVASPRASLVYLLRALEINPHSQPARQGIHWAVKRARACGGARPRRRIVDPAIPAHGLVRPRPLVGGNALSWGIIFLALLFAMAWFALPGSTRSAVADQMTGWTRSEPVALAQVNLSKATRTFTPTFTSTFTPSPTATFTPTPTFTFTPSPIPTDTPTQTPVPSDTPEPTESPPPIPDFPDVGKSEHWVDVNLSLQTAYAYRGTELVRSFIVSTGTWQYPTVTGQFHIYVKYRYANMSGPGYYLPDVPYVMYFYEGYGLHGTYWHNNFGTPMSHGCVNFTIEDAGWIFDFTEVGSLVNVHY